MKKLARRPFTLTTILLVLAFACSLTVNGFAGKQKATFRVPKGLPAVKFPEGKPPSAAMIELGKQLFEGNY